MTEIIVMPLKMWLINLKLIYYIKNILINKIRMMNLPFDVLNIILEYDGRIKYIHT
jgi:hypothetical protein